VLVSETLPSFIQLDHYLLTLKVYTTSNLDVREYKIAIMGSLGNPSLEREHVFLLKVNEYFDPN
jgi:hypothetical protein